MLKRILTILMSLPLLLLGSTAPIVGAGDKTPSSADAIFSWLDPAASVRPKPARTNEDRKEETVYITRTGEKYHRGTCRYLSRSKIPIKRKDAVARGYDPCKVCKP